MRERPFVPAAIGGGAGRFRLARRHYVPHLLPASASRSCSRCRPRDLPRVRVLVPRARPARRTRRRSATSSPTDNARCWRAGGGLRCFRARDPDRVDDGRDARRALARAPAPALAIGAGAVTALLEIDGPLGRRSAPATASYRPCPTRAHGRRGRAARRRRRERQRQDRARPLTPAAAARNAGVSGSVRLGGRGLLELRPRRAPAECALADSL